MNTILIPKEIVSNLIETIKNLKTFYVYILEDGRVLGTDLRCITIHSTQMKIIPNFSFCGSSNAIAKLLKYAKSNNKDAFIDIDESSNITSLYTDLTVYDRIEYYDKAIAKSIVDKISILDFDITANYSSMIGPDVLTGREEFDFIINLSSADGAKFMNYKNHLMSIYDGLISLNKSDSLSIAIYEIANREYKNFIVEFTVGKKSQQIKSYVRYRVLD